MARPDVPRLSTSMVMTCLSRWSWAFQSRNHFEINSLPGALILNCFPLNVNGGKDDNNNNNDNDMQCILSTPETKRRKVKSNQSTDMIPSIGRTVQHLTNLSLTLSLLSRPTDRPEHSPPENPPPLSLSHYSATVPKGANDKKLLMYGTCDLPGISGLH